MRDAARDLATDADRRAYAEAFAILAPLVIYIAICGALASRNGYSFFQGATVAWLSGSLIASMFIAAIHKATK